MCWSCAGVSARFFLEMDSSGLWSDLIMKDCTCEALTCIVTCSNGLKYLRMVSLMMACLTC